MSLTVTVLGSASGVPVHGRRHSSVAVRSGDDVVLLDAGEGVTHACLEAAVDLRTLEAVYISHTHADHVSGLPMLLQAMHLARREHPLAVRVPADRVAWFGDLVRGMCMFEGRWNYPIECMPLTPLSAHVHDGITVTPHPTRHLQRLVEAAAHAGIGVSSFGWTVESGAAVLAVTGDMADEHDLPPSLSRAHLCLIDAAHVRLPHLFALADAHPGVRFVLTHIPPELDASLPEVTSRLADRFDGRVVCARDGMMLTVGDQP